MGLPGSGKGTQGKMLADSCGMHLISMGELVRMYVTGERRQEMLQGKLLNDQEIIAMLDRVLKTIPDDEDCILDGFPRTVPQAEWLLGQIQSGRFKLNYIFHLTAPPEALKARLIGRGRNDDHEDIIDARFQEYQNLTAPLLEWYKQHDLLVTDIQAERPVDQVHADLVKYFKQA
jgi:adenylate kinase